MSKDASVFLKASLKHFRVTGSIAPSSKYLARKLAAPIRVKPKMNVVELGAGTGSVTKHLLSILPNNARLFSLELNEELADHLEQTINDSRLFLIRGDASKLGEYLKKYKIEKVDYIVSGLPLGSLPVKIRQAIYREISNCLDQNGVYTQFQYLLVNLREIKKHFIVDKISFEIRNIPPAFVYTCRIKNPA